ncbi:MAG: hypothetical protein RIB86_22585, partial [Imperialibacter sp.]
LNPREQHYNKLFNPSFFATHFTISLIVASIGIYRAIIFDPREIYFAGPLIFLIVFWAMNKLTILSTGENMMIAGGVDLIPDNKKYRARINFFVLVFLSVILPGLVVNFINS